jgi:hypothetical protein
MPELTSCEAAAGVAGSWLANSLDNVSAYSGRVASSEALCALLV